MQQSKVLLLAGSLSVLPLTLFIFQFLPAAWPFSTIYVSAMSIYWIILFCLLTLISQFKPIRYIISILSLQPTRSLLKWVAFLPVLGVLFIAFLPTIARISVFSFLLVLCMAVVNGTIEEVFWRGAYIIEFPKNWVVGFGLSTLLFTAWHISLWYLPNIQYHGGFGALVGGAFIMGVLWSYIARKVNAVRFGIYAHILVNIFAFTGLFVDNQAGMHF